MWLYIVFVIIRRIPFYTFFGCFRNLVIPDQNKSLVAKDGLLDVLFPMLSVTSFPVVFKLLGTLRIVIDKQGMQLLETF